MKHLLFILLISFVGCASADSIKTEPAKPELQCEPSGCSGQVCAEKGKGVITTCLMLPRFECVKKSRCEVQSDGKCGWTPTQDYLSCLKRYEPAQRR